MGEKFAQLDELLHFLAALYDLERVLAADLLGLDTQEVAARAHAVKKARALDALLKAADKVHRAFAFVLLDFRINHMRRAIYHGLYEAAMSPLTDVSI